MRIVVDTSTVIAVIAGEAEKARLIELTRDATIVAPPSIAWEVGNAFSAMLKRSRINLEQALEAIEVFQEIALEILDIDLKAAVRLAGKLDIYAYDAYVLQCAIEHSLPLISLDQRLNDIARREGIQVIEVEP
ncbi:MAG: type II toxin-antitoxin system VapC family toxin [Anaerolineales bacterium]|nr:type II toxin-antitoxin system VapC family toxin [Anaerolineales bacterium]